MTTRANFSLCNFVMFPFLIVAKCQNFSSLKFIWYFFISFLVLVSVNYDILSKLTRVQIHPIKIDLRWKSTQFFLIFFLFLNLFYIFFAFFKISFYYYFTITNTPNPYPLSVSGFQIWLGGFWSGGFWTWPAKYAPKTLQRKNSFLNGKKFAWRHF